MAIVNLKIVDYNKYINYLLVIHAFALPVSKALNVLTTGLIILLYILEGDYKEKIKILKDNKFVIFLFLFLAFSLLSILWNPSSKYEAWLYYKKYYHFLLIPIMITSLKKEYISYIITAFLSAIAVSEIMSYGIFFELWKYKNVQAHDPSPFMGHIDYSVYLCFTLILLLSRVFKENISLKVKVLYVLSFFLVTSNLFLNGGRTGQVLFIVAVFLLLFLKIKNKLYSIIISSILLVSILFTAYNLSPNFKHRSNAFKNDIYNIVNHNDFRGSFGQRISFWYIGSHIFMDNFIMGTGINNETNNMQVYNNKLKMKTRNFNSQPVNDVHNSFIMYAMQLGIIGLILFIMIFYYAIRLPLDKKNKDLNIVFLVIFIGFSNASNTFHTLDSMTLFAMFSGLFASISKLNYKENL